VSVMPELPLDPTEQDLFVTQRPETIHVATDQKEMTHWIDCRDSLRRAFPYKKSQDNSQLVPATPLDTEGTEGQRNRGSHSPCRAGLQTGTDEEWRLLGCYAVRLL
jgi:hypothetical protein